MKGATNYSLTTKSHGVLHIAYCISEVASLICNFHGLIIIVCLPSQEKKKKIHINCVFAFTWDDFHTQEKLQMILMQFFLGVNKVYYGQCESDESHYI